MEVRLEGISHKEVGHTPVFDNAVGLWGVGTTTAHATMFSPTYASFHDRCETTSFVSIHSV